GVGCNRASNTCRARHNHSLGQGFDEAVTLRGLSEFYLTATTSTSCLRRYLPDAAVDLVELDPPFNSNRDDNVIFRDESGDATDAQPRASSVVRLPRAVVEGSRQTRHFARPVGAA
ncbi:MAG: hypothetical protein M3O77_04170, partial [Chloroflexota bacterium]|nr:hypothetical protein [Chloroflexota bacterium]